MALRYDRRTGPDVPGAAGGAAGGGFSNVSTGDIARALQRERFRQGLSLRDVSARTGIPVAQLRAGETGALHSHDQLAMLKTVRHYADFLGLPGDRYALSLLEHWPTRAAPAWRPQLAESADPPQSSGGTLREQPVAPRSNENETAVYAFCDTGVAPAVPASYASLVWRPSRRKPPVLLKVLVGVVAVAIVAAAAALAVDRVKPGWLRAIGAAAARTPAAPPSPSQSTSRTAVHPPRAHIASDPAGSAPPGTLRPATTSPGGAVYHVGASPFTLSISAAGGRCWAEVTSSDANAPLFAGVLAPGQVRSFTIGQSATVNLGSVAGRISVEAGSLHLLSTSKPPTAPYKVALTSSR